MDITEVRIKLMESSEDRLRAFCSITIDDCFVVRDLKIIDGTSGPFVAMPSRKMAGHCQRCGYKNHLRAHYCNQCGVKVRLDSDFVDSPQKLYADVAHPINSACRELIQDAVLEEFEAELARSRQPGYRSRYDDEFGDDVDHPLQAGGPDPVSPRRESAREQKRDASDAIIDSACPPGPPPPRSGQRGGSGRRAETSRRGGRDSVSSDFRPEPPDEDEDDGFGRGIL